MGVAEDARDDEEDDEDGRPGKAIVGVNELVAEGGDEQSEKGEDQDARPAWKGVLRVRGGEELRPYDGVDGGPAETGDDVEQCN